MGTHLGPSIGATSRYSPHVGFIIHQLENEYHADDEYVKEKFAWLASVLGAFSGWETRFYKCREFADKIIQISGWDNAEQHYRDFHSSKLIRDVLDEFGGVVDVKSSWHTDIPFRRVPLDSPELTLVRFFVKNAERHTFETNLQSWVPSIMKKCGRKFPYGWRCGGGWRDQDKPNDLSKYDERISQFPYEDEPDDAEEWDMVVPWPNKEVWTRELGTKEATNPFLYVLEHVVRLEVYHLEEMDLDFEVKYSSEEEDDYESDESEDEE